MSPFESRSQVVPLSGIIPPRRVETMPVKLSVNPACRAAIDAFASEMMRQELQRNLDALAEERAEGRTRPHRPDPKGE